MAVSYYDSALRSSLLTYKGDILSIPNKGFTGNYRILDVLSKKQLNMNELNETLEADSVDLLRSIISYTELTHNYLMENREELQASQGRLFISETFKSLYEVGLNAAYKMQFLEPNSSEFIKRGLSFAGFSKSILFQEQSGELGFVQGSGLPLQTKNEYYRIKKDIENLEERFNLNLQADLVANNDSIRKINSELIRLNTKLDLFRDSVLSKKANFDTNNSYSGEYFNEVNGYLESQPEKAILEFFVGEEFIYTFFLSKGKLSFDRVRLTEHLLKSLEVVKRAISERPSVADFEEEFEQFVISSKLVFDSLLSQSLDYTNSEVSELTIVPDDFLAQLPFEVLLTSYSQQEYYYQLDYLFKTYTINYALTSSEIISEPSKKTSKKHLFAVGYAGGNVNAERSKYGGLPGTEDEIEYLRTRVSGDFFLGEEGSKMTFLRDAKDYDLLHLAVHGESDSLNRYQSKLIFNGEEGILKTSDLYISGLKARLAILSACESGTGQVNIGEGTFSIARSFALVGVPSIVMSLWKVNDQTASELMVGFHENLQSGLAVNDALSMAKLDFISNSDQYTSHPYYWSAFVSLGEEVKFENNKSFALWLRIVLGVLLTTLLILVIVQIMKKRKGVVKLPL